MRNKKTLLLIIVMTLLIGLFIFLGVIICIKTNGAGCTFFIIPLFGIVITTGLVIGYITNKDYNQHITPPEQKDTNEDVIIKMDEEMKRPFEQLDKKKKVEKTETTVDNSFGIIYGIISIIFSLAFFFICIFRFISEIGIAGIIFTIVLDSVFFVSGIIAIIISIKTIVKTNKKKENDSDD